MASFQEANLSKGNEEDALYDRDDHFRRLLDAYFRSCINHTSNEREIVTIFGPSGAGKTALALQLEGRVAQDGGYFISGKFNQLSGHLQTKMEHYGPFVEAFTDLCGKVTATGNERIKSVKAALERVLSKIELDVLHESIPALGQILGTQYSDSTWSGQVLKRGLDAENRFVQIMCRFVLAVASELPLVVFLDEIHRSNAKSMKLLRSIAVASRQFTPCRLLLICASTDSDENLTWLHSLISEDGVLSTNIQVFGISEEALNEIISTQLGVSKNRSKPLADILHYKTRGNILFASLLFKVMLDDQLVIKDASGEWHWDESQIIQETDASSISQLLQKMMSPLPNNAKELLKVASCLESTFTETLIWSAASLRRPEVASSLQLFEKMGLMARNAASSETYYFSHDMMQEAAYNLIPEPERASFHVGVGQRLLHWLPGDQQDDHLMLIVDQLSRDINLIEDPEDKLAYAELYLRAGQRAAARSEFTVSSVLLKIGIGLVGRRRWKDHYNISLRLYNTLAEVEFYSGNLDQVDALVATVIKKSHNLNDSLIAYFTKIYSMGTRGEMVAAMDEALSVLTKLGESFPRKLGVILRTRAHFRCQHILRTKSDVHILSLPLMRDQSKLAAMRLLIVASSFAFYVSKELMPMFNSRLIDTTLKHGMNDMSCVSFASLSLMHAIRGDLSQADRFGNLALKLFKRYPAKEWEARIALCIYAGVYPTKFPFRDSLEPLLSGHMSGLVVGDMQNSLSCAALYAGISVRCGIPLPHLRSKIQSFRDLCAKYRINTVLSILDALMQLLLNFMGESNDPLVLTGEFFNEGDAANQRNPATYVLVLHFKHMLAVYFGDGSTQEVLEKRLQLHLNKMYPFVLIHFKFLAGLAAARLSRSDVKRKRRAIHCLSQLRKYAERCPQNYLNKVCLIEAELASKAGHYQDALVKYRQSIELAGEQKMIHEEGLACERAGHAMRECGKEEMAREFFLQARSCFEKWGAKAKVDQLDALQVTK